MYFTRAATALIALIALGYQKTGAEARETRQPTPSPTGCDLSCGEGTQQEGDTCVGNISCGEGTTECDGICLPGDCLGRLNTNTRSLPDCPVLCGDNTVQQDNTCVGLECGDGTVNCAGVCFPGSSCPGPTRVRTLYDERNLLGLVEGEEYDEFLKHHESRMNDALTFVLCLIPGSPFYGRKVPQTECIPTEETPAFSEEHLENSPAASQWAIPSSEDASLLSADPGIWKIDDFLSNEESDKLFSIMNKHGYERGMFGPCTKKSLIQNAGHAHSTSKNKVCLKISPETVCEGPYQLSGCNNKTNPEDSAFISDIFSRIKTLWSTDLEPREHASFQLTTGATPLVHQHLDNDKSISVVLYLTNGGAATTFPNIDVSITPKKGTVATWLNQYKDGSFNLNAIHGVQAHPSSAGDRATVIFFFEQSPEELIMSQA